MSRVVVTSNERLNRFGCAPWEGEAVEERLLPDVARAATTSHARDRAFEVGPLIGVVGLGETLTQVRRVVQAFLEPVRQFVDSVDRAVAHQFVMSHSGSREEVGEYRSAIDEAVQNRTGSGNLQLLAEIVNRSIQHISIEGIALHWIMRLRTMLLGIVALSVSSASPALAQRFPFEQSFDVTGPSVLDVSTIRGMIEVTGGEAGRIVVVGTATVRVDWNVPANAAELARRVADNPPIQREGQTVKLRPPADPAEQRAVTVSYEVRVPPETEVATSSESGATMVRGVAGAVVIRTQSGAIDVMQLGGTGVVSSGSGAVTVDDAAGSLTITTNSSSVTARSVAGDLRVRTRSGAIDAVLSGEGDADVETGSSAIRLSGIRGAVIAATQSGRVSLQGVPRRNWVASAGSGSVDISTAFPVPFTLDASSGSGSVKVVGAPVQGSVSKRKVAGSFAGGGPLVQVASRSGSIVVRLTGETDRSE